MPALKEVYTYCNQTLLHPKLFNPPTKDFTVYILKMTERSIKQIIINKYLNNKFIQETLKLI